MKRLPPRVRQPLQPVTSPGPGSFAVARRPPAGHRVPLATTLLGAGAGLGTYLGASRATIGTGNGRSLLCSKLQGQGVSLWRDRLVWSRAAGHTLLFELPGACPGPCRPWACPGPCQPWALLCLWLRNLFVLQFKPPIWHPFRALVRADLAGLWPRAPTCSASGS